MQTLPTLLKKLHTLHRQRADVEHEIAEVERDIIATGKAPPKPRKPRATNAEVVEVVRAAVKVLRDAGGPLPRREIASRLGISPWAASYRLGKAIEAKFVEKVGAGRYRVTNVVPVF